MEDQRDEGIDFIWIELDWLLIFLSVFLKNVLLLFLVRRLRYQGIQLRSK